jgi:hypothetical protein
MPPKFAVGIRACCVAVALSLAVADAAEQKSSLKGATRDQVLARYGEPRSVIVAGNREMLFFATEKVTLRDGVVTDVETLPDTTASAPRAPAEGTAAPAAPSTQPGASPTEQPPSVLPVPGATPSQSTPPPPAPESASRLEIKSVRRPGTDYVRPPRKESTAATPAPAPTPPAPAADQTPPPAASSAPPTSSMPAPSPATRTVNSTTPGSATLSERGATERPETPKDEEKAVETSDSDKKATAKIKAARRRLDLADMEDEQPTLFTPTTYVIAALLIGGGFAYIMWRNRQRQLELAATTVSLTPFTAPTATTSSVRFDAGLLAQLEWKRFEELVASYYGKTGVIAVRTKSGPASPVHIKISWKGEPRPFAYVQCIPNPTGLIEVAPVQALVAALAVDDIRRGYVVTTGKFSVGARDLAEEKAITLLPGEIFLEKLNALPDAARAE